MSCLFGSRFDLHQALRDAQTAHRLCCRHQGKRQQGSERELLAKKFFRKLLKGLQYVPRVMITDKLKSYGAAKREILPGVDHRQSRSLNNRCEHSHRPTRQREYRMQGFKAPGLDHGIGHFMLFEVGSAARAPVPPMPVSRQTSSAASDRKTAPLPSSRQAG